MIIGGFHPLSLSDFPHIPAAVIFTQGCNWRCSYCHNQALLSMQGKLPPRDFVEVAAKIFSRKKLAPGVVITGGEPTLQKDLYSDIKYLRAGGLKVKLDTNGSRPQILKKLLHSGLLDYIAMDVKAPFVSCTDAKKYQEIVCKTVIMKNIEESIALIAASGIPHQFRTTWPPHLLCEAEIDAIRTSLPAGSEFVVQKYRHVTIE